MVSTCYPVKNRVAKYQAVLFFQAALDVGGRVGNSLPPAIFGNHGGQLVAHPTVCHLATSRCRSILVFRLPKRGRNAEAA